jgi:hypothetical protein
MTDLAVRRIFNKCLFCLFILTQNICRAGFYTGAAPNAAFDSVYDHDFFLLMCVFNVGNIPILFTETAAIPMPAVWIKFLKRLLHPFFPGKPACHLKEKIKPDGIHQRGGNAHGHNQQNQQNCCQQDQLF